MKLVDVTTWEEVSLPNDLLWKDEHSWTPVVSTVSYSLSGALLIDSGTMEAGRPITLEPPEESMGWVSRATADKLLLWAQSPTRKMTLVLEYPSDDRQFTVMFRHYDGAVEASPVKGFPGHSHDDWFTVAIRLIEVE